MDDTAAAFVAELKRWRDVRGLSQARLATGMGYHRTYLSKIESGQERPTREFVQQAENTLKTGGALTRAFRDVERARQVSPAPAQVEPPADTDDVPGALVVEHDRAVLHYDGSTYRATQRRTLFNAGDQPVTKYLIRISVDRFPDSPEKSNRLYREDPLTWGELDLVAELDDREPMAWRVHNDRDAFKEVWLLFQNREGQFPLYPGESATISYSYTVPDTKWGHWFQRAVRLPTRRLSVELDFPLDLDPHVWGVETSLVADRAALRTAIQRTQSGGRRMFSWSTENPPLHARYRMEWTFRARPEPSDGEPVTPPSPSATMASLGILQEGEELLSVASRPFDLPTETTEAQEVIDRILAAMDDVAAVHVFAKGMGIAAPQIGIDRAAAIVKTPAGDLITLINPQIVEESTDVDEQYEGCLSFFDVRGRVPRPAWITVEHQDLDGTTRLTTFSEGVARLVAHEVDHLHGQLYKTRMRPGVSPIPVAEYRGTGQSWSYH